MKIRTWLGSLLAAVSVSMLAPSAATAATAVASPIDYSHWKLTLPVDSKGNLSGKAFEIPALMLVKGYTSPYFYVGPDGGRVFVVPPVGAMTTAQTSPRSELREQLSPPWDSPNWYSTTESYLDAQLAVNKLPDSSGRTIIGQIHGGDAGVLAKIYITVASKTATTGTVYAQMLNSPNGSSTYTTWTLATKVPLNKPFVYNISLIKGSLRFSAAGSKQVSATINSLWSSVPLYFKAGNYPKSNGLAGDDSKVTFYALNITHR